jgi:hypothetical protein
MIANNTSMWANDRSGDDMFDRIKDAASQANILEFVESLPLGFDTLVGDRGVLLSGGQRQRLFFARELFRKPRLLILDSASEKGIQNSSVGIYNIPLHFEVIITPERRTKITKNGHCCVFYILDLVATTVSYSNGILKSRYLRYCG